VILLIRVVDLGFGALSTTNGGIFWFGYENRIRFLFWFGNENRMTPPSDSHYEKIDNWMTMPSGCHFKIKWQPDDILIRLSIFSQCELDLGVIRFSFFCQCESDGCVIGAIVKLKFYIRVQKEGIRVQEKLILNHKPH